jgi:hypothetical protein
VSPVVQRRDALVAELVELRSVINAADARCAAITKELADLEDGHPLGCTSTVQFLSWQAGLSGGAAKALSTVGERLEELPSLQQAAAAGELSVWQARAIASAAADDDEAAGLVEIARYSTCSQLETACRHIARTRAAGDDREGAAHRARRLRTWWSGQGTLRVDGELGVEAGAILRSALDHAVDELPEDTADDAEDRQAARQADGLELLARAFLDGGGEERSSSGAPPGHLSVHIGLERLLQLDTFGAGPSDAGDADEPDPADGPTAEDKELAGLCRLGWHGSGVADSLVRRLCCDATIQAVVRDPDGHPLALGHRFRLVNRPLRRALYRRDGGRCQAPGCDARRFLHAHHIIAWADGGPTELPNLVLLCSWHHRMVHDGLLVVTTVDGRPQVTHTRPPPAWRPPPIRHVKLAAAAAGVAPRPDAARSHWEGDHIDYACFDAAFLNRPSLN